ncbi:hypothetical protein GCM10010309_32740 [Streptomyces violaceochromogenes]|nr:hypothetical protein GCM10010309_32740 [Streptomyces violaceochromogenes]
MVSSSPTTSGHTTDHIRPSSHRVTASPANTSRNSPDTRADIRSAARDLSELRGAVTQAPYWLRARPQQPRPSEGGPQRMEYMLKMYKAASI